MNAQSRCGLLNGGLLVRGSATLWLLIMTLGLSLVNRGQADDIENPAAKPAVVAESRRAPLDVRLTDGSVLKVAVVDTVIPLKTKYGTLSIPLADIRRIEFATRVSDEVRTRIDTLVKQLGGEYQLREAASRELLELGAIAYPAIVAATDNSDAEIVVRAERLIEQFHRSVPANELHLQTSDLVFTHQSQIDGTIELSAIRIKSAALGEQSLPLGMIRQLGDGQLAAAHGLPDPGTLMRFGNQQGQTLAFNVNGWMQGMPQQGVVWGTDVYTLDSNLSMAAVHAGVLKPGQPGVVQVQILPARNNYNASSRNGVVSQNFGQFPAGSFQFVRTPARQPQPPPGQMQPPQGNPFQVQPQLAPAMPAQFPVAR